MQELQESPEMYSFAARDCALVAIATGKKAQNLRELRNGLLAVHPGSIYYHFWGGLLRPQFAEYEYNNDFASWAYHALYEKKLAERLGMVNPSDFADLEGVRQELIEIIETRLDETEYIPWARADQQFYFIRSQTVVFDTGLRVKRPEELVDLLPVMSVGSIFYHFIDAWRRTEDRSDDFSAWLAGYGETYRELREKIMSIDPYFCSLTEIREILSLLFKEYFEGKL